MKKCLQGNPPEATDTDAEIISLTPNSLMATHRFICEICKKGFQREQNLQLHKRAHNLPWKLKQRTSKEAMKKKKRIYICPEKACPHHEPSLALGDLTGIKKHFSRKHGEKKWKCEKCSKKYAVQSDLKAHSKICGTREYKCDCGTIFSRRDSFITHRAFCDAIAEEISNPSIIHHHHDLLHASSSHRQFSSFINNGGTDSLEPPHMELLLHEVSKLDDQYQNPIPQSLFADYQVASPHISATALLQKAAQIGGTMRSSIFHDQMASLNPGSSSSSSSSLFRGAFEGISSNFMMEFNGAGRSEGMTRDFLSMRAFPPN